MRKKDFLIDVKSELLSVKKIVAILILVVLAAVVVINSQSFKNEVNIEPQMDREEGVDPIVSWTDFKGSQSRTFIFKAEAEEIRRVTVKFQNPSLRDSKGRVKVTLLDKNDKKLAESSLKASMIKNQYNTYFDFINDSESLNSSRLLKKGTGSKEKVGIPIETGETYKVLIEGENIKTPTDFYIGYDLLDKYSESKILPKDKVSDDKLWVGCKYWHMVYGPMMKIILMILASLIFVLIPFTRIKKERELNKVLLRLMLIGSPFVYFLFIFRSTGFTLPDMLEFFKERGLLIVALNLFVIALPIIVLYAIIGRTKTTILLTTVLWYVFALANYVLILFRNNPLTASDFASFGTAMDVVGGYTFVWSAASLWALSVAGCYFAVALSLKGYKGLSWKGRVAAILVAALYAGAFYQMFFRSDFLEDHNIKMVRFWFKASYRKNGYPLSFAHSVATVRVKKPKDYSTDYVNKAVKGYESDEVSGKAVVSKKTPNIIVVMNESLSDLSVRGEIDVENEYMPYINSLKENTIKGTLHVSVFGGGTANSEYEFLTGNTMAFFPANNMPFNSNVRKGQPSLVNSLKKMGYGKAVAFHPGMNDSYNRNKAYPALGFDEFISVEDLKSPELVRSFVSDKQDYEIVEKAHEDFRKKDKKSPFFMFNVTIQNHGGFEFNTGVIEDKIHILNPQLQLPELQQYLNLVKISDDAFRGLIDYYKNYDEPTVIIMYGDHQPNVGEEFVEVVSEQKVNKKYSETELNERRFHTPFIIWANYDIEEKSGVVLSDNYLAAYALKSLGMPLTGYDKFRLDMMKKIPFYTTIGWGDTKGKTYSGDEKIKDKDISKIVKDYEIIQYNNAVDIKNRIDNFFEYRRR